jgi:hypothetical protein
LLSKLYAYCDRQQDEADCLAFAPTKEELESTYTWLKDRDGSSSWPEHVQTSLVAIAEKLGYEITIK